MAQRRAAPRHWLRNRDTRGAAAAIAAACQVPAVPKPGPPEGQPTDPPAGAPTEQPGALPALAIADVSASEGDRLLRMPVSLDRAAGEPVSVTFATEDGTATEWHRSLVNRCAHLASS